jgi:dienelactone hydrolase
MVDQPAGRLFGIVTEPVDAAPVDLCIVFLNAAAVRRVGPNRMWVETARRWAARGVSSVRIDLAGIGDSDGELYDGFDELYGAGFVEQLQAVLDALPARGLPARFAIAGLCSGGYWAFQGALRDDRVAAALMLNPRALFWDPRLEAERDLRRMRRKLLSGLTVRRILRGEIEVGPGRIAAAVLQALRRNDAPVNEELDAAFDRLRDTGKHVVFLFSGDEPLSDELEAAGLLARDERWPNITVQRIPGRDHTLRPVWMQQLAHDALDRAIERVAGRG